MGAKNYPDFVAQALRKLARPNYRTEPHILGLVELAEAIEIRRAFSEVPTSEWIEVWLSIYETVAGQREDPELNALLQSATESLTRTSFAARLPFHCSFMALADLWSEPHPSMQVLTDIAGSGKHLHAITMALRWGVRWIQPTLLGRRTFISAADGMAVLRVLLSHAKAMEPVFAEELAALAAVYRLDEEKAEILAMLEQTAPECYASAVEMIAEDIDRGAYETAMLEYTDAQEDLGSPLDYVPGYWPRKTRSVQYSIGNSNPLSGSEAGYWELNRFIQL